MIRLDPHGPIPPYEQIRQQLADRIGDGQLTAGQRLPSIRQLAGDLRVAPGTVARAYTELETAGLIESSRARGTRVRDGSSVNAGLRDAAQEFARHARRQGLTQDAALGLVRAAWQQAPHS